MKLVEINRTMDGTNHVFKGEGAASCCLFILRKDYMPRQFHITFHYPLRKGFVTHRAEFPLTTLPEVLKQIPATGTFHGNDECFGIELSNLANMWVENLAHVTEHYDDLGPEDQSCDACNENQPEGIEDL